MPKTPARAFTAARPARFGGAPPAPYAEDPSAPPILRFEAALPRLPVPPLADTAAKYLDSVRPHVDQAQFAKTTKAVQGFLESPLAAELQQRLQARAVEPEITNWLADWWNDEAYMAYRDPVVVFVSYYYVHVDDKRIRDPAKRAASLLKAMMSFRTLVESGKLEPEKVKNLALSMESYKWLFHASRYPAMPADTAHKFDPASHNTVVFVRKNKFFEVSLAGPDGRELSAPELEAQVRKVIELAGSEPAPPVGVLTSDNRDHWHAAREALGAASPANAESLKRIEAAMVVVALDDFAPVTREAASWACWVGDGRNRFYDKHQLIVFENGKSGFLGEHSCMDGTPTLRMTEFMLASLAAGKIDLAGPSSGASALPTPAELKFTLDGTSKKNIQDAAARFDELVGSHDMEVLHYEGYGKETIKQFKASPDAWAQLVKQLAVHKMHGRPGVCYESAQTRKYARGRTEVIRSASNESKAWAEAMLNPDVSDADRAALFRKAVSRHLTYAGWAADGRGVDRHLFGLKKLLREGEAVPDIYTDEAFSKTNHWELSTSNLSSPFLDGWGYGEVVPDGYGLSYSIGDHYIRWTITSLKRRTAEFKHHLAEAASETMAMMRRAREAEMKQAEEGKSKL